MAFFQRALVAPVSWPRPPWTFRRRWTLSPRCPLQSERPAPQQLSATELRSRIALLEHAARAYRAELESRTARLDGNPFGDEGLAALVAPPPADYGVSYLFNGVVSSQRYLSL